MIMVFLRRGFLPSELQMAKFKGGTVGRGLWVARRISSITGLSPKGSASISDARTRVVLSGILASGNLDHTWYTMGYLLHRWQDTTKLSRKGALLCMSQLCEFMIL